MVMEMQRLELSAVELARIHLSLVEFPSEHSDILEHLFSTTHRPHRGFLSDTQLAQSLFIEHFSRGILTTYKNIYIYIYKD